MATPFAIGRVPEVLPLLGKQDRWQFGGSLYPPSHLVVPEVLLGLCVDLSVFPTLGNNTPSVICACDVLVEGCVECFLFCDLQVTITAFALGIYFLFLI